MAMPGSYGEKLPFETYSLRSTSASTVSGVVVTPNGKGAVNAVVHLFASDGQHISVYCDNDGSFILRGVPVGSHLLQAHLMGYYFPEVRL
jgi:hypothetical protein